MKKNYRKLQLILKMVVSENYFYHISFSEFKITLQGKYNPFLVKEIKHIFKFSPDDNGYMSATKYNVEITLT